MQPSKSPLPVAQTPGPNQNSAAAGSTCANANELGVGVGKGGLAFTQSQLPQFAASEDLAGHWQYPQAQALAAAKQWPGAGAARSLVAGPSAADLYRPSKVAPHSAAGHTPLMRENSVPLKMASPNATLVCKFMLFIDFSCLK